MRIGLAVRSSSSALMLSLSEEACIVLQILSRKVDAYHPAGRVELQKAFLMGLQEEALGSALGQEE